MNQRPTVLLTNDDGHLASGIRHLRDALAAWADVVVVAPETEQSATSHALTLHRPLRLRRVEDQLWALDGTPADCVYVALHAEGKALARRPDMVVSGLNHGVNLGADVFYSGTVGGAREGALRGIPSLACSAPSDGDRRAAARFCADFARRMLDAVGARPEAERARPILLNLNVPGGAGPWPLRRTVIGSRMYEDQVVFSRDPRGREYLWIGGSEHSHQAVSGSDTEAFDEGAASVTALVLDLTSAGDAAFVSALVP